MTASQPPNPTKNLYTEATRLLAKTANPVGTQIELYVQTLGGFRVWRQDEEVPTTAWGREKAIHLFQFFITMRRQYVHKEQIMDRLWPDLDLDKGDRDFKVALNSINKALEPEREPRSEPRFVKRYGLAYGIDFEFVWVDTEVMEQLIAAGNHAMLNEHDKESTAEFAIACYDTAVKLYYGDYLPERRYEDWTSAERERLQLLGLNTMTTLADLLLTRNPLESIRLTQRVLAIDPVWEDAYRVLMRAFVVQQNRPMALRSYERCVAVLDEEFGIEPLPETTELYERVLNNQEVV
ncbi:MAG: bacterial transcriptional activator domain-containing protein [Caldilineaceae bacterium]|nr:bacterial transcriptional activator domain-containing protein [Caldilineaceae bacterium]